MRIVQWLGITGLSFIALVLIVRVAAVVLVLARGTSPDISGALGALTGTLVIAALVIWAIARIWRSLRDPKAK